METLVENSHSSHWSPDILLHVQNSKLLTKLLFLVDSGTRGIGTITSSEGQLKGVLSYESYKSPLAEVLKYETDSELNGANQWKVWTPHNHELVFHASECVEGTSPHYSTFLWRHERPHGRLPSSNTFWSDSGKRCPSISEQLYELCMYARGKWEQEITTIAKGMLKEGSKLFDIPYRSSRRLS